MLRFSRVVGYRSVCVVSRRKIGLAQEWKWDRERRWGTGSWRRGQSRVGDELMCCSIYPVC
jgi:hypothetical protein